jgi:hypothetical protein
VKPRAAGEADDSFLVQSDEVRQLRDVVLVVTQPNHGCDSSYPRVSCMAAPANLLDAGWRALRWHRARKQPLLAKCLYPHAVS